MGKKGQSGAIGSADLRARFYRIYLFDSLLELFL